MHVSYISTETWLSSLVGNKGEVSSQRGSGEASWRQCPPSDILREEMEVVGQGRSQTETQVLPSSGNQQLEKRGREESVAQLLDLTLTLLCSCHASMLEGSRSFFLPIFFLGF